jgi:hypothetical protein
MVFSHQIKPCKLQQNKLQSAIAIPSKKKGGKIPAIGVAVSMFSLAFFLRFKLMPETIE